MNLRAVARRHASSVDPMLRGSRTTNLWIAVALIVVTAAVYAPVRQYGYIVFDDPAYVFENPYVVGGLTWENIVHAMTQPEAGTWKNPASFFAPLTALSHIVIVQFFGLAPGAHHLGNVVFHALNTVLLFVLFTRLTAKPWRSAWVAGLFALHPLHVESVAWISERKDVLSTFFWMLTALAYVSYARQPAARRYVLLLAAYIAALLSKPMVATQPYVLLLLDVWPLRRLAIKGLLPEPQAGDTPAPGQPASLARLVAEKVPLMVLGGIVSVLGVVVQRAGGAQNESLMSDRIANAVVSYATYLGKLFWPTRLAAPYPFTLLPVWQVVGAATLLVSITAVAVWGIRRRPYLVVGWLWYLGVLLPTIGLVQNLSLAPRADRYTYVPSIGIFMILAWGIPDLLAEWRRLRIASVAAGVAALAACGVLTARQLPVWQDSVSFFGHTLAVTPDNLVAHFVVGNELLQQGQIERAWTHFNEVARIGDHRMRLPSYWEQRGPIEPYYSSALANLGLILMRRGELSAAKDYYLAALSLDPANGRAHTRLGMILAAQGDTAGAVAQHREAVRVAPTLAVAYANLGVALETVGQIDDAIAAYRDGVRLEPQNAEARSNLAAALAGAGRVPDAIEQFRIAVELNPQLAEARFGLAAAYVQAGRVGEAIAELDVVLQQRPDATAVAATLAGLLATAEDAQLRDGPRALQLADAAAQREADNADVLNSLAAAYAEVGRFADAIRVAEQALAQANRQGQHALATTLTQRLLVYRAGRPARAGAPHAQTP